MSFVIRAHFDGRAIVPDTKVDLPSDQPLEVEVRVLASNESATGPGSTRVDIASTPFFGMWANRKDMSDSISWVREERAKWNSRHSDQD